MKRARGRSHSKCLSTGTDGIRSDVFKTFSPFSNAGTMAKALFSGLAVPVGLSSLSLRLKNHGTRCTPEEDAKSY